ncbi:MAG: hypothetical protein AB7O48_07040 [Cyclobacteriaceae bacterium]
MKNQIAVFALLIIFSAELQAQTIYTADNNPGAIGGVNTFTGPTALTDAITAAAAGDIIHVTRSATDYGPATISKQLSLFGIGLNPDTDGTTRSIVNTLTVDNPAASGTRISGLHINTVLEIGGVAGNLNNLLIENSHIRQIKHLSGTTTLTNIMIRNNVVGSFFTTNEEKILLIDGTTSNVVIANNVLYTTFNASGTGGVISVGNASSVENNLFIGNGVAQTYSFRNFVGNSVKNNIFYRLRPQGIGTFANNTFENNLSYNTGNDVFVTTNGNTSSNNIEGQDPLIANVGAVNGISYPTFDPTLGTGSPAIGSGEGGTDMGVLGGAAPMKLNGTLIPLIQSITLPSIILKGTDLPVQIQATGN